MAATANKRMTVAAAGRMRSEAMAAGLMFPLPWMLEKRGGSLLFGGKGERRVVKLAWFLQWGGGVLFITWEAGRFGWMTVEVGNSWRLEQLS